MEVKNLDAYYGNVKAIRDINMPMRRNAVTAIIGPSGCGKSTLVRCLNRMHELVPGGRIEGQILFDGEDINAREVDPVELRSRIGMVFQKPNPFPKSIYNNVAFGLQINGFRGNMAEAVERSLRQAALWDEVKDRLKDSALSLSGGQQQRLCIARAIAIEPEVILMDEPCSALDPIATLAHRGPDTGIEGAVQHCHRNPQHAAGGEGVGRDGIPDGGRRQVGLPGGVRQHGADVYESQPRTDGGVYHGPVQLAEMLPGGMAE